MTNEQGNKKLYGLLGKNISYSLSPVMHNAAFRHFNIPAEYKIFDVKENELDDFWQKEVLAGKISGFNVTVPYKIKVKKLLEEHSGEAALQDWVKIIGALNTIKVEGEKLSGYNTDCFGFYDALTLELGFDSKIVKGIFIAGAGGAGRAICLYLIGMTDTDIYVSDVDKDQLNSLKDDVKQKFSSKVSKFNLIETSDKASQVMHECDLIINATPLGTKEGDDRSAVPLESLKEGQSIYDLVYARETVLIKTAKEKGLLSANGLGMLINQAAIAFHVWTGKPIEEVKQVMRKAIEKNRK